MKSDVVPKAPQPAADRSLRQGLSRCENCGAQSAWAPVFAPDHEVYRCGRCRGWSYAGPVELSAEQIYDTSYFVGGEYADYAATLPAQRRNFRRKLGLLRRVGVTVGPETRALEIGCATGAFLELLRAEGVRQLLGVEVSEYARARARSAGLTVLAPDAPELERQVRELQPNLIVAWDVWEHLTQPATTIASYIQAAHPQVAVALTTVDSSSGVARLRGPRWRQFHPPTHLHYPSRASLRSFFEQQAMRVELHRSFGYYRPALEYLRALRLQQLVSGSERLRAHPVYLNLWDTQLIVARRSSV